MTLKNWCISTVAALALVACSQSTDPADITDPGKTIASDAIHDAFMATANASFTVADASEADLSGLVAALPAYAALTWDSQSFDPASGATVFDGLSIGIGGDTKFGLNFEEAKVWGLEPDLLTARLNGERLSEPGPLFSRLEGSNVSYFGVAQSMNGLFDALMAEIGDDMPAEFVLQVDQFESLTERVVVSGAGLRPWELSLLTPEAIAQLDDEIPSEALDIAHIGQTLIAVSRSISIDESISMNTEVALQMQQPGADLDAAFTMGFVGAKNVRGFDFDIYTARDVQSSQTSTYTDMTGMGEGVSLTGFPVGFSMVQAEQYAASTMSDLRLDKAMGFLARSELPGMDERDLLSFGRTEVSDYVVQLNDREILSAERAYFNGDGFEWVIPSDVSFGFEGATLNTGELTGFFQVLFETFMDGAAGAEMDETDQAQLDLVREGVQKAIDLLPEHGLDTLPFDAAFSAKWAADSGPTDFSAEFDADGYGKSAFELALTLPAYDALKFAYDADDKEAAFEDAFEAVFAFRGGRVFEQDKGGYDKLFGFAHDLGKQYPDQGWGAMLGSMEPAQLRSYLGTIMRMGKSAAAEEFPPAADWMEAYASYLESGGSFEFASNPPTPITKELVDSYEDDPEPEEIVEIFGLTVTHTK